MSRYELSVHASCYYFPEAPAEIARADLDVLGRLALNDTGTKPKIGNVGCFRRISDDDTPRGRRLTWPVGHEFSLVRDRTRLEQGKLRV